MRSNTVSDEKDECMVGVVKWLRHMVVVHACVGSNPITHPIFYFIVIGDKLLSAYFNDDSTNQACGT